MSSSPPTTVQFAGVAANVPIFTLSPEVRARIGELAEKLLDAGHAVIALLDEFDADSEDGEGGGK